MLEIRRGPWTRCVACALLLLASVTSLAAQVAFRAESMPTPGDASIEALARRAVNKAFLDEHPGIEIEPFQMPIVEGTESSQLMAIAAGLPPHLMYVNFRLSSTYLAQGFLEPLEILLARLRSEDSRVREWDDGGQWLADPTPDEIEAALAAIHERVPPLAWQVIYRDDESGDPSEHVWAVPWGNLVMALLYRKDLFSEAGLDPEDPPEDWDELLEYARVLTRPEKRQYGIMAHQGEVISWWAFTFLVSNGARAVERGEDGQWRAVYGSPEAAEAVHYVWRLLREPWERDGETFVGTAAMDSGANQWLLWTRGQIAMCFNYLDEELTGNINPQLTGIAPVPVAPGGGRGSEFNCKMFGIFSGSSPEQKLAAMEYLWYVTSADARRIRTRVYVENGFGKFVSPDNLREFGYDRILRQVPPGWQQTFEESMKNGVPEPYGRNTHHVYRYWSEPINAALELPLGDLPYERAIGEIQSLLEASEQDVNVRFLGNLPEETMHRRRVISSAVIIAIALIFAVGMRHVWRYFTLASQEALPTRARSKYIWGFILIAPALILVAMWSYIPLVGGLAITAFDYQLVRDSVYVGVDNFAEVLFDEMFWQCMRRTLYFVALMIGLGFWPPILLAILLQEVPTDFAKYLYRTVFYLPAVVSLVVTMFLWKQLYDSSEHGVLNQLWLGLNQLGPLGGTCVKLVVLGLWLSLITALVAFPIRLTELSLWAKGAMWSLALVFIGLTVWPLAKAYMGPSALEIEANALDPATVGGLSAVGQVFAGLVGQFHLSPLRWVQSPQMAMLCVVIPTIWAGAGPGCILYLAALKTVPEELYEAAAIDGASHWHKVFYITLPRLKYLIMIQFIAAVIGAFKGGTDLILALTGGGPNNATKIVPYEIFIRAFADLRFGVGAAMAWVLGALLIGFTAYQLKMLSKAEFKAAG